MYAVIDSNNQSVAFHDEYKPVSQFVKQQKNPNYKIVKIKKRVSHQIEESFIFDELYLIKYKGEYVPNYLSKEAVVVYNNFKDNLNKCESILYNLLDEELDDDEIKSIKKTIKVLKSKAKKDKGFNMDLLKKELELYNSYKECIDYDNK